MGEFLIIKWHQSFQKEDCKTLKKKERQWFEENIKLCYTLKQNESPMRKQEKHIPLAETCINWNTTFLTCLLNNFTISNEFFTKLTSRSGRLPDLSIKSKPTIAAGICKKILLTCLRNSWSKIWHLLKVGRRRYLYNSWNLKANGTWHTCCKQESVLSFFLIPCYSFIAYNKIII